MPDYQLGIWLKGDAGGRADIRYLRPELWAALPIMAATFYWLHPDRKFTITSGLDGKHSAKSKHYKGQAVDVRTRGMTVATKKTLAKELAKALGDDWDVVVEKTHIHIEWDP